MISVSIRWRLGDEIMALPIYEGLKRRWPERRLYVQCNYPQLLFDNPHVDSVNRPPHRFAHRIELRGADRTAYRLAHYARAAGIATPESRPRLYYDDWSTPLLRDVPQPFVAVAPGASWASKRWPVDRWRDLCRRLAGQNVSLVELGHPDEAIGVGLNLTGRTNVRDAACVLHAAQCLICCDSGLMHLALAAGTPALALFGPTEPSILVRDEPLLHVVQTPAPCGGCWNVSLDMRAPGACPRERADCMDAIGVHAVMERAVALLNGEE